MTAIDRRAHGGRWWPRLSLSADGAPTVDACACIAAAAMDTCTCITAATVNTRTCVATTDGGGLRWGEAAVM